jgi:hypothetical protein
MPGNPAPVQNKTKKPFAVPTPGTPAAPNVQGTPGSPCLISWPSASVPLVGSVGGGCILSKTNVRAMLGGLFIGAAAGIGIAGVIVLVGAGFRKSGAAGQVAKVAAFVPGGQGVAAGAAALQSRSPAPVQRHQRQRQREREHGSQG